MSFDRVEIPYGAYWSTPFVRWQGAFQHLHAMRFAAHVAKAELAKRSISPQVFDFGVFGMTVVQFQSFYGAPWPLYEIGATRISGPTLSQVCATGVRALIAGASEIQTGLASVALTITADRCSNGPHIYFPAPRSPGGTGTTEDQVLYNFSHDPIGGHAMGDTAENVAIKYGITTEQQHAVVLRRYEQYQDALANGRKFQKRYMTLPFPVPKPNFRGEDTAIEGDEGITASTAEGLAKLKPLKEGGTLTFGGQTHPADGNAGIVLALPEKAAELSRNPNIRVRIRAFGQGRAAVAFMPEAPIFASKAALDRAGVSIKDIAAIKSHNPFAVNDIAFAQATGVDLNSMNNFGCSLIWGHPQGPTGSRGIIELIEELALRGGGLGLFQGCAAGDSSLAVVIEVADR